MIDLEACPRCGALGWVYPCSECRNAELCRCGHPEGQHGPDGCTAPTRLVGDMTYAERPCYCETFSDCYEGDPS